MKDISQYVQHSFQDEIVWDELRYKVILFRNGFPISYIDLKDQENTLEKAMAKASDLLSGGGKSLKSV